VKQQAHIIACTVSVWMLSD